MSRILTTEKLIASVRRRAMIPDDTSTYTDEDIINIMNEEIDEQVLADVMVTNQEHLVYAHPIEVIRDQSQYKIPYRSIGNKLRELSYLDSSGDTYELSRISMEDLSDYRNGFNNGNLDVFWVQGDSINFVNTRVNDYTTVMFYYYLRPNVLVPSDQVGVITAINRTTGVISLSNFPSDFSNIPEMDFVSSRSPSTILKFDVQPISVSGSTMTITFSVDDIPSTLNVGDFICEREESPVPNIPTEFHPILAQATAVHILEALGDTEGLSNANNKLEKMKKAIVQITNDRVEGSPQKINPRNTPLVQAQSTGRTRKGNY